MLTYDISQSQDESCRNTKWQTLRKEEERPFLKARWKNRQACDRKTAQLGTITTVPSVPKA